MVLLSITTVYQDDNKIFFEELRLEYFKTGNKGQHLQNITSQPIDVPMSTNSRSFIGSCMIIEEDKPNPIEKQHGNVKKYWARHAIEKNMSREILQLVDNGGSVSLQTDDLLVEFLLHCDLQEHTNHSVSQSILRRF